MIVVTVNFDKNISDFDNMIKVWKRTARKYMPDANIKVLEIPAPEKIKRQCDKYMAYSSTYAFVEMAKWVLDQNDDAIITDADTMFLGDCSSVFENEFDIACTIREGRCFVNAGVLFYRNTEKGRLLLNKIISMSESIYKNPDMFKNILKRYLGADQAAVSIMAKQNKILKLPCEIWNSEQHSWDKFSRETKIVHMKSSLWDLAHKEKTRSEYEKDHNVYKIFEIWKSFLKTGEW